MLTIVSFLGARKNERNALPLSVSTFKTVPSFVGTPDKGSACDGFLPLFLGTYAFSTGG